MLRWMFALSTDVRSSVFVFKQLRKMPYGAHINITPYADKQT